MTSTVARLRELLSDADGAHYLTDPQVQRLVFAAAAALPALLDVVERLSWLRDPYDDEYEYCPYCHEDIVYNPCGATKPEPASVHDPGCPWLAARRLCGMEQDGAS